MNRRDVSFYEDEKEYIDMELCSSPESREFEFQMSISCNDTETFTSPADDLFCNGKLLPLYHLSTTAATTPLDSCCDLSHDDHFIEWSNELNAFIINNTTSTWINKMKNSILGMKFRAYLKSLFNSSSRNFQKASDKINVMKRIEEGVQRRSFSGGSSSSSSSSSTYSSSFGYRRSSSAAEVEGSIEAAIAHCKKSHHI